MNSNENLAKELFLLSLEKMRACDWESAEQDLEKCYSLFPDRLSVIVNLSAVKFKLNKLDASFELSEKALSQQPDLKEAWLNKGNIFKAIHNLHHAIDCYKNALEIDGTFSDAIVSLAACYKKTGSYTAAKELLQRALPKARSKEFFLGDLIHLKLITCDWSDLDYYINECRDLVLNKINSISPFNLLSFSDRPEEILDVAQLNIKKHAFVKWKYSKSRSEKITIAYYSPDFRSHALTFLISEFLTSHNKNKFSLIALSKGKKPDSANDPYFKRLEETFDEIYYLDELSVRDIQKLCLSLDIDVAVDLAGHTSGGNLELFAERIAPVQIEFLGYPGTSGCKNIDYIVTDKFISKTDDSCFLSEKPMYLSPSFQPNDSKRYKPKKSLDIIKKFNLDADLLISGLSSTHKFNPSLFDTWSKIIEKQDSVLLLLSVDSTDTAKNVLAEFASRGIPSNNIRFLPRLPYTEYLDVLSSCHIALDTFPFNGGTTTSDALWAGTPVITLAGSSFHSRMSGSLLSAVGLGELITSSSNDYIETAISLLKNKSEVLRLKDYLAKNTFSVFDGSNNCAQFEKALCAILDDLREPSSSVNCYTGKYIF